MGLVRRLSALFLMSGGLLLAQATLPSTVPTTLPGSGAGVPPTVAGIESPASAANGTHAAEVAFVSGKLEVVADGASLNTILSQIGRLTGMKITGGVADEPVYGRYGPGPASEILSTLLDGTGSNMLLREATAARSAELILTRRVGGVTPPDPNAQRDNQDAAYEQARPRYGRPMQYPPDHSAPDARGQPASSDPGPRSPQDIYLDLQRLQQSKQTRTTPSQ